MAPQLLEKLNRRLADVRGRNPHGDPVFRWFHSSDLQLRYPCRVSASAYEQLRQLDEDRWVIAKWFGPPSREAWKAQFPDLGYPENGLYYIVGDAMLLEGIEPNDTITDDVIGRLKAIEFKTFKDFLEEIEQSRTQKENSHKSTISDAVEDAAVAFGNLPGARGGSVSFGGVGNSLPFGGKEN